MDDTIADGVAALAICGAIAAELDARLGQGFGEAVIRRIERDLERFKDNGNEYDQRDLTAIGDGLETFRSVIIAAKS